MCNGIIGKKLGMTNLFAADGRFIPVTVVQAGPCVVTQVKTEEKDGYNALQLGFGQKKANRINKPLQGHFRPAEAVRLLSCARSLSKTHLNTAPDRPSTWTYSR